MHFDVPLPFPLSTKASRWTFHFAFEKRRVSAWDHTVLHVRIGVANLLFHRKALTQFLASCAPFRMEDKPSVVEGNADTSGTPKLGAHRMDKTQFLNQLLPDW